jgi:hypothetical protein
MGQRELSTPPSPLPLYVELKADGRFSDFIFGQKARAWFEKIDLRVKGPGWVTASGRDSDSNPSYYLFNNWYAPPHSPKTTLECTSE